MAYLKSKEAWPGLRSIGLADAERKVGEQVSSERRYDITSLAGNARAFGYYRSTVSMSLSAGR